MKRVIFGVFGISFITHGRIGLKYDIMMYHDHLWKWLHLGHGLLVFLILAPFWLSETDQMYIFQAWQCMGEMGRSLPCSSLSCDIPRNEKSKFYHMKIVQLPSGGYPWPLCSQTRLVVISISVPHLKPSYCSLFQHRTFIDEKDLLVPDLQICWSDRTTRCWYCSLKTYHQAIYPH